MKKLLDIMFVYSTKSAPMLVSKSYYLQLEPYHTHNTAFRLQDNGLSHLGFEQGDYLLFTQEADTYRDKVLLIRQEDEYIVGIGELIDPVQTIIKNKEVQMAFHSENIRIVGVLSGVIKHFNSTVIKKDKIADID